MWEVSAVREVSTALELNAVWEVSAVQEVSAAREVSTMQEMSAAAQAWVPELREGFLHPAVQAIGGFLPCPAGAAAQATVRRAPCLCPLPGDLLLAWEQFCPLECVGSWPSS